MTLGSRIPHLNTAPNLNSLKDLGYVEPDQQVIFVNLIYLENLVLDPSHEKVVWGPVLVSWL